EAFRRTRSPEGAHAFALHVLPMGRSRMSVDGKRKGGGHQRGEDEFFHGAFPCSITVKSLWHPLFFRPANNGGKLHLTLARKASPSPAAAKRRFHASLKPLVMG